MNSNENLPVGIFIDRIESAKRLIDKANRKLVKQYDSKEHKHTALLEYFKELGIIIELLKDAISELDVIVKKLDKGNYLVMSLTVKGFRERISKVVLDCSTLCGSGVESDLLEIHLNMISEVKSSIHYVERHGIDYIIKNVKVKICKNQK